MTAADAISVVLPTFNRLPALRETLPAVLAMDGIAEVVVVVDGSVDGTGRWLAGQDDPRLVVLEQDNAGSPAARNRGIDAARSPWLLMTEDDCRLPVDFAVTLREVAALCDAQIVSAPWVTLGPDETPDAALAARRAAARPTIGLATHPGVFPTTDLATPFLNGIFLARREVFDRVRYHGYAGNAWREETDLFLAANAAGLRTVLTPRTASFQTDRWTGGQHTSRVRWEVRALRNNWHFLRRNAAALRALGEIRGPVRAQAGFAAGRLRTVAVGFVGARLRARSGR